MTLDDERPDDELDAARVSELVTVIALISAHAGEYPGTGAIPCPVCKTGTIAYALYGGRRTRRAMRARCSTAGCIAFLS